MPKQKDCCAEFDEDNLEEDPDYRMKIELNTPRIQEDVRNVLTEEKRVYSALKNNKQLKFPCQCSNLCSYINLIKPVSNAFNKLYEEYQDLHMDYTTLFRSHHYEFEEDTVIVYHNSFSPDLDFPASSMPLSFLLEMDDLQEDIDLLPERKHSIINETIWEQSCEGYIEAIRFNMIKISQSKWVRFWGWFKSHFWGRRKCVCFHCNYRDVLVDFRTGLLRLHLEYVELYAQYIALLKATYLSDSTTIDWKSIEMLEPDYKRIRNALESENF